MSRELALMSILPILAVLGNAVWMRTPMDSFGIFC